MASKPVRIGKIKRLKFTTKAGTAIYPRLNSPDTKFKTEGEYSVKVRLEGDDAVHFQQLVSEYEKDAHEQAQENAGRKLKFGPHRPFKPAEDDDGEEIPGVIVANFKLRASGTRRDSGETWTQKPVVVDAQRNPIAAIVGGGSKIRVSGLLKPYFNAATGGFGISAEVRAVQVLDLVAPGGDFTSDFDEEDGYVAPTADEGDGFGDESGNSGTQGDTGDDGEEKDDF